MSHDGIIRLNLDDGPVAVLVEALVSREANKPHEPTLRKIAGVYGAAAEAVRKARTSQELTELGKREATKRALASATAALEPHEAKVRELESSLDATRRKALERPASERTPERLMLEREIRDRLVEQRIDPLLVAGRYLTAVRNGDDVLVSAIENAPAAFALIDDATRRQGEDARIARSPHAGEVARLEGDHALLRQVVNTTRTHLREMAESHGVQLEEVA